MKQKERSINELLQLILNNINMISEPWCGGLCILVGHLCLIGIISHTEQSILSKYINNNKPINFVTLCHFMKGYHYFYWKKHSKGPRILWLKKHIKKTDPNKPVKIKNFSFNI